MINENELPQGKASGENNLKAETEKLEQRIRELQLMLDLTSETYNYSKGTVILNPDNFSVKIKIVKVLNKKLSIMCYQN